MKSLLIVLPLLLSGCAAQEQARAQRAMKSHFATCEKLGFAVDSDGWRNCVLQRYQADESRRMMAAHSYMLTHPQMRTCRWVGRGVVCN